jgi:hypothetical protein
MLLLMLLIIFFAMFRRFSFIFAAIFIFAACFSFDAADERQMRYASSAQRRALMLSFAARC